MFAETLTPSGHGGLKALSKLVFQAAESFAPLSSSQLNGRATPCPSLLGPDLSSTSAPSLILQCNGDLAERGSSSSSNGHARTLAVKNEAVAVVMDERGRECDATEVSRGVSPRRRGGDLEEGEGEGVGEVEREGRTSDSGTTSPPSSSPNDLTFYLPVNDPEVVGSRAEDAETTFENEASSVTRL